MSLAVGGVTHLHAQAKPADPASVSQPEDQSKLKQKDVQRKNDEEVYTLSPFVVEDTVGTNTYRATSTLAGTRVRTDLNDVASAISVITSQFLKDTGVTGNQGLLIYTPSTEVAGFGGNFSGSAGVKTPNEVTTLINPSSNNRVRGLSAADNTRDYFLTDIPWDSFNVGRIDLQRGPNSILFGVGSPAGIINASVNDASYRNSYKLQNRVDEYGSFRNSLDANQVLLKNKLALRVSLLDDKQKFQQEPAFNNQKRVYAALRYDADLFGNGNHTTVRAKIEDGRVHSNNPRILPPNDLITPWFNGLYNKATLNTLLPGHGSQSPTDPIVLLYSPGGVGNFSFQGISSTPDVKYYYTDGSNLPGKVIVGMANSSYGGNGGPGQAYRPGTVPTYSFYAASALPGGAFYYDKVLTDSSVFNFFDNLLDGPNKREWQNWRAENIDVQQTFFNDKLAFDLTYDHQAYHAGQVSWLTGKFYAVGVEINQTLSDGSTNANLGRPYVASTDAFGNGSSNIDRKSKRGIVTLDLDSADYFGKNWLTKVLGRSVFTGLVNQDIKEQRSLSWAQHAATPELIDLITPGATSSYGSITGTRAWDWIYYLGGSLSSQSSASGANLNRITTTLTPGASAVVRYFNSTWNAPSTVNKTDPYTYVNINTGQTVTGTQVDNPANYVGWTNGGVNWLSADNPKDFPSLVTGGNRSKFVDNSQGFTWQGYLLGGDLIPTFGWRKDRVVNYDTNAPLNSANGTAALDYDLKPSSYRVAQGQSRNWSGVYHLPKKWTSKFLGGTRISFLYNESSNFKADAPRRNLMGNVIDNPQGKTREKGVVVSVLNDRLTLRANWYKTVTTNATLTSGATALFGNGSYLMYRLAAFGYVSAAIVQDRMNGISDGIGLDTALAGWENYAYADGVPGVSITDDLTNTSPTSAYQTAQQTINAKKMVQAWLNAPSFLNKAFYTFWNVPVPLDPDKARATGFLHDAFGGTSPFSDFLTAVTVLSPSASTLPVTTVDTLSKGSEFEVIFQPVDNWNIAVNYVRTNATRTNIDGATRIFMEQLNTFYSGDAGYLRQFGVNSSAFIVSSAWRDGLWLPYQVALASQGQSAPEVAPWRLNLVTNYTFDHGKLKGLMVGGAGRFEASRISGYRYNASLGFLDVNQPLKGPQDSHYDLWFGYTKKLNYRNLAWHIQVNLRNVGEKTRLVPSYYEPDGSLALSRIQEGMTWALTNSLEF
ncbi:MAG: hypothetical protein HYV95_05350 [Opitutae bacterium]|nr:hypothetical protein [Opitutae bacterium]